MALNNFQCSSCDVSILEKTRDECGGLCMPCFMRLNNGFKPSQIKSIESRGLSNIAEKWVSLLRQGRPNIRNPIISSMGLDAFPIVHNAIDDYIRAKTDTFESDKVLTILKELKLLPDEELKQYISSVEEFVVELIRVSK